MNTVASLLSPRRAGSAFVIALVAGVLTACGGGGGGGGGGFPSEAATVTEDNKARAADAGIEGSLAALGSEDFPEAPIAALMSPAALSEERVEQLRALVDGVLARVAALPEVATGVSGSIIGDCGGSVSYNFGENRTVMVYKDFCVSDEEGNTTFSGRVEIRTPSETSTRITYTNFVVRHPDGSRDTLPNMTIACDESGCRTSSDFRGTNGNQYRIENAVVDDNLDGSYDVSLRVYDRQLGYVEVEATGLVRCDNGFSAGTITLVGAAEGGFDVRITFNGCGDFSVNILYVA